MTFMRVAVIRLARSSHARRSHRRAASWVAALALAIMSFAAAAAAPKQGVQTPGVYRMMLGSFEITALSDGVFDLATDRMLSGAGPGVVHSLLAESFHDDVVSTSVNAYLVNTGDRLILVDTGAAQRFGPTLGRLAANLSTSGYRPEQVDIVLLTHMHPDHIGGLVAEGKQMFANAVVRVDRREATYWLDPDAVDRATEDRKDFFRGAVSATAPYASTGRLQFFDAPADLARGIRAIPAPGHTPGHTIYSIESGGHRLDLWGDLTQVASVQFAHPEVTIGFDSDGPEIVRQRSVAYADAARGRYLVAASHLPFPGIGHVRKDANGYVWVPIDYDDIH